MNELPFRKLITAVIGVSLSPNGMKGEIGSHLKDLSSGKSTLIPQDKFEAVPNPNFYFVPLSVVKDLSNDQKLLYKLCVSVMAGTFDPALRVVILPGINWARWLTLAILILYYYTTLVNPPENLKTVVEFIICIYAPTWFELKSNPRCTDAPRIMFKALKKYKELPQWIQDTVMPIVEGGSHWFHPENVKLAMLADSRIEVRRKAIDLILEDRKNPYQQEKPKSGKGSEKKIQIFNLPQFSYVTDSYDP